MHNLSIIEDEINKKVVQFDIFPVVQTSTTGLKE